MKVFILVSLILFNLLVTQARAEELKEISYERTNPGSFSYSIKRFREKTLLFLLSPVPSKKTKVHKLVLNSRLAELNKVVDEKNIAHIEKSSQRYSATVGEYTDRVLSKAVNSKEEAEKLLGEHRTHVESFLVNFDSTTAEWRFIKHDLDYLDLNLQKLKK